MARQTLQYLVGLLILILIGTFVVLSTVVQFFGINSADIILDHEMTLWERWARQPPLSSTPQDHSMDAEELDRLLRGVGEKVGNGDNLSMFVDEQGFLLPQKPAEETLVPRIIHQTWKDERLPEKYKAVSDECRKLHPNYEYMLWTDEMAHEFIKDNYPWFLSTFEGYTYPIQRADAIRYFILHRYGGFYLDLDVGCKRSMEPLRYAPLILPQTFPVGISNDIMSSIAGHPFWLMAIHNLPSFDRSFGSNYPTVMFSTGPMFLSFQYGQWPYTHGLNRGGNEEWWGQRTEEEREVRVLPRKWYGKNLKDGEVAKNAFWKHFYGSSWHDSDAGFINFLGRHGKAILRIGTLLVIIGAIRLYYMRRRARRSLPILSTSLFNQPVTIPLPSTSQNSQREGFLYYLPIRFVPSDSTSSSIRGRRRNSDANLDNAARQRMKTDAASPDVVPMQLLKER